MTWRARQAVLEFYHPIVWVDRSSWTWVLVFWPSPRWTVMTQWTLIAPQQRAITVARTIKAIQTKQRCGHLVPGCTWWTEHVCKPWARVKLIYACTVPHNPSCLFENEYMFTVQRYCVWLISEFTPGDRSYSWLGHLLCWWFPGGIAEELQSPRNSNNLFVWRQESWKRYTLKNTQTFAL